MADNTNTSSKEFVVERKLSLPGVEEPSEGMQLSNSKCEEQTRLKSPSKEQKEILEQLSRKEEQIKEQERERRRHRTTMVKTTRQSGSSERNSNHANTIQSQPPPPLSLATPQFIRKVSLPEVEEPSEELPPSTASQREKLIHLESPSNEQKDILAQVELAPEERIKAQERSRRANRSKYRLPEHHAPQQSTNTISTGGSSRYSVSLDDIQNSEMENSRLRRDQKGHDKKKQRLSSSKKWLHPQRSAMTAPPIDHLNANESHNELSDEDWRAKEQAMNRQPTLPRQNSSGMIQSTPIMESETLDDTDHAVTNDSGTFNDTDHAINNDDTDHAVKSGGSSMLYSSNHKKGSMRSIKSGASFFDESDDDSRNNYTGIVPVGAVAVDGGGDERFLAKASMNHITAPSHRTIEDDSLPMNHDHNSININSVPVPQESSQVPQESFKIKEASSSSPSPSWWTTRQCKIVFGIVLVVAIIAISVGVALSGGGGDGGGGDGSDNDQDEERAVFLKEILYDVSGDLLDESSTPQNLAYEWILMEDTQISTLSTNPSKIKARYIMTLFYYATGGNTTWRNKYRWLEPDVDECQWPPLAGDLGDWCNGGQDMFGFYLANWGLSGSLPKELVELDLIELEIRNEDDFFNGAIDPVIYDMVFLEYIELSSNSLEGSIPSELSKLTDLEYLSLGVNDFDGSIPLEIFKLNKLKLLSFHDNAIEADMTQFVRLMSTEMVDLAHLELQANQIIGSIPSEIGRLDKLTHLNIKDNDLDGNIPTELGVLEGLSFFDFADTQITGAASPPEEVCNLGIALLQCNDDLCDCTPYDDCDDTSCCTSCSCSIFPLPCGD